MGFETSKRSRQLHIGKRGKAEETADVRARKYRLWVQLWGPGQRSRDHLLTMNSA